VKRRAFLLAPLAIAATNSRADVDYARVVPGVVLQFPRDHGSHPAFRTEWWYVTGWVRDEAGHDFGIQITFFRNRTGIEDSGGSQFAPKQLLFAHAAIADPALGRLRHDQRAARAGLGLAEAATGTTDVHIGTWLLRLDGDTYRAHVDAREFTLDLQFDAEHPPLLQGIAGVSSKGPRPEQASFYYSRPDLQAAGTLTLDGRTLPVRGHAWLDHEWSSAYLAKEAQGWDWTGLYFDDGSALMAFRMRDASGAVFWAGGAIGDAGGNIQTLAPADVRFTPTRFWRSPHTGITYPVAFALHAGGVDVTLEPLFDDQELDSRASVGTIYWEGAVRALAAGREIGRGYLELTGYGVALKL
jgi:predicted secreted hydrolase